MSTADGRDTVGYAGHSPLPWTASDTHAGFEGYVAVFDGDDNHIMTFGDMEDCSWRDICDAHMVARAMNAFPALVEALQQAIAEYEQTATDNYEGTKHIVVARALIAQLRAALAQAGVSDD